MSARVEKITRVATDRRLELEAGVSAIFFANAEVGAVGFSTGVARFEPQGRLSCHTHECGESITIVHGCAEVRSKAGRMCCRRLIPSMFRLGWHTPQPIWIRPVN
jgi:hypothetical protein